MFCLIYAPAFSIECAAVVERRAGAGVRRRCRRVGGELDDVGVVRDARDGVNCSLHDIALCDACDRVDALTSCLIDGVSPAVWALIIVQKIFHLPVKYKARLIRNADSVYDWRASGARSCSKRKSNERGNGSVLHL